ncbi:hypothetical protein [Streptomyces sp. NPDC054794]
MPRRQPAKLKALRQAVIEARLAISSKRWHSARYALSRARALVNALPAELTVQEREQLSQLRKKYAARGTPAAMKRKKPKRTLATRASRNPVAKKSAANATAQKPKPTPVRDLGDRFINRAALGYEPADKA